MRTPQPEDCYQHMNGNTYEVILVANQHSVRPDYPTTVIYSGLNGKVWAKTLDNFLSKMTYLPNVQFNKGDC